VLVKKCSLAIIRRSLVIKPWRMKPLRVRGNGSGLLEYDGCARLTIDNITIVTQP
jgi:hypothetical protein